MFEIPEGILRLPRGGRPAPRPVIVTLVPATPQVSRVRSPDVICTTLTWRETVRPVDTGA